MVKQIELLLKIQLLNAFGYNEAKHSNDKKLKNRLKSLSLAYGILGFTIIMYMGATIAGLVSLGLKDIVPTYIASITSLLILFFTIFKAGDAIFNLKSYEKVIVLPVKPATIIISRFLCMYVFNFAMALLVILPSTVVYAVMVNPELMFYFVIIIGSFFLPLIPMSIATIIGAGIMAISSRMKHKSIINTIISLTVTLAVICFSFVISSGSETISNQKVAELASKFIEKFGSLYPPSILFSNAALKGSILDFALFIVISAALFAFLVFVIQKGFTKISTNLNSSIAKRNYKVKILHRNTQFKAIFIKDLKRYFASTIYVINTGMGYVLAIVFSVFILIMGPEKVDGYIHIKNSVTMFAPLIFSFMFCISPPTTSGISIEGKQWWITKSLPISQKIVYDSKILCGFVVALPCFLISLVIISFAIKLDALQFLALVLLPLSVIVFSNVIGLFVNIKMPLFNWESETVVVKQSSSVLVNMLISFGTVGAIFGLTFALKFINTQIVMIATAFILLIASLVIYSKMIKIKTTTIE